MARIFITGSADGLGLLSAKLLVQQGHSVLLHARNDHRAENALENCPGAETVVVGDLSRLEGMQEVARQVNALGHFDAVIHNAGVLQASPSDLFNVNVLAPYVLTCLIEKPKRLVYLSSTLHLQGHFRLDDLANNLAHINYADSKLYVLMLAKAVARLWTDVHSNAIHPGWVPTKLGGHGAPDDLEKGYETQSWLAVSDEKAVEVTGNYFFHKQPVSYNPQADNIALQDQLLELCGNLSGVQLR